MEINITDQAVATYVALLKGRFGTNLGQVIEDEIFDEMNQGNGDYSLPEEWNDEEFSRWAKMDLEWNAAEEGEEFVDVEFATTLFESNLMMGLEDYYI
jgi:hypothetical protein